MRRTIYLPLVALTAIFLAACPKANQDFEAGRKAEMLQDYDTALVDYERALRANPTNVEYKLRADKMHYQDGQFHLEKGIKDFNQGNLELALTEFQKAQAIDPSNPGADQQIKKTMQLLAAKNASRGPQYGRPRDRGRPRPAVRTAGTQATIARTHQPDHDE